VYHGLFHGDPEQASPASAIHPGPGWAEFVRSRRGYDVPAANDAMFAMNDDVPTFFAGVFAPPDAGHLVPLPGMVREGVEMGLLRRDKVDSPNAPLFRDHVSNNQLASDVEKHPYFRYQPMQRLENLTTTRSNVFAVWITAGFFEMEPVPANHRAAVLSSMPTVEEGQALFDRLYPEGMWLSRELGSDTGQTERYRGFYMIDRSIPVAFDPGQNHNVDRAILIRRRIE
jgi:hypothetical protein